MSESVITGPEFAGKTLVCGAMPAQKKCPIDFPLLVTKGNVLSVGDRIDNLSY